MRGQCFHLKQRPSFGIQERTYESMALRYDWKKEKDCVFLLLSLSGVGVDIAEEEETKLGAKICHGS